MPRKTRPRTAKAPELIVLFTSALPNGFTNVHLVRGPVDPSTPSVPASGLIWVNLDGTGYLGVNVVQSWDGLDALPEVVRDAALAACGDAEAKARLAGPRLAAPVSPLVGMDGAPLLARNGHT